MKKPTIWIDADACPKVIKEVIFKASARLQLEVVLVANSSMFVPQSPLIKLVKVEAGADVADSFIAANVVSFDIVVTADIPLAALIVEKQATAINVRGEIYTEENVHERLSMRNFMKELRDSGVETGGPEAFSAKDKERFANAFNKILSLLKF
ncbi:MAG: YaiI/YqxD family protein [Bdellovibrio sp.]|nr:YaiI/YqxD family protein [Bdellovibrio sp.]